MIEELANIDHRLSALEAKFDSFSNEQKDGSNKRKKPARKNEKECSRPTAKRLASGSKDTKNPNAITRKKMKQRQRFKPSRRGVIAQARDAKRLRVRGKDQPRRLVMTSIQRVYLRPHPMLSPFQQQRFLTSAASVTAPSAPLKYGRIMPLVS